MGRIHVAFFHNGLSGAVKWQKKKRRGRRRRKKKKKKRKELQRGKNDEGANAPLWHYAGADGFCFTNIASCRWSWRRFEHVRAHLGIFMKLTNCSLSPSRASCVAFVLRFFKRVLDAPRTEEQAETWFRTDRSLSLLVSKDFLCFLASFSLLLRGVWSIIATCRRYSTRRNIELPK